MKQVYTSKKIIPSCYCSSQDGQPTKHPLNNIAPKAWTT